MKLTVEGIKNTAEWESKGYSLPKFDRAAVEAATKAELLLQLLPFHGQISEENIPYSPIHLYF